jgi:hypothetical protein
MAKTATKNVQTERNEAFSKAEAFAMWKHESKKCTYYTGKSKGGKSLIAFLNSKKDNPKQPDISVYESVSADEKLGKSLCGLWVQQSASGNKHLSGKLNGEWVTGFFTKSKNEKAPAFTVYFSDKLPKKEEATTTAEVTADAAEDDKYPF